MSEAFTLREAAAWTAGDAVAGEPGARFDAVSIDSRTVAPGALFVAIAGPHHDGHDHLAAAVAAGATGVVVARGREIPALAASVLITDDTTRALGALAAGHRARFTGPVVAITGSNGKTSTKEMAAAILAVSAPCLRNEGNLNNEFGLPLTLLRREPQHAAAVVEIGMNHRGEIAPLAAIAKPTVGAITNVGTAHIEHLGSREEIALEKGDLVASLAADATAVLNADDELARAQAARTAARVWLFGLGPDADVRAESVRSVDGRGFAFDLRSPLGSAPVFVVGLAETAVANALCAAAAALAAAASLDDVVAGLARCRPVKGRLDPIGLSGGGVVIDDTYNANPQSLEVALRILAGPGGPEGGARIAVIGDMGELGDVADDAHREAGRMAARLGVDQLFAAGERARLVVEGAAGAGMDATRVHASTDVEETARQVLKVLDPRDRVLVKGSRAMRMERVVAALVGSDAA